jgi:hypothetical protein
MSGSPSSSSSAEVTPDSGSLGSAKMSPSKPGFSAEDNDGTVNLQTTFNGSSNNTVAWGFTLSYQLQVTVTSVVSVATCGVFKNGSKTSYNYNKPNQGSGYPWHSSIPSQSLNTNYQLSCVWQWTNAAETYTLDWWVNYDLT